MKNFEKRGLQDGLLLGIVIAFLWLFTGIDFYSPVVAILFVVLIKQPRIIHIFKSKDKSNGI